MDHQQQTQQTEKIIVEMLEFLESSSEEENDIDQITMEKSSHDEISGLNKDFNDNIVIENNKNNIKSRGDLKKETKPISTIANELKKLKQQFQWNTRGIAFNNKKLAIFHKSPANTNDSINCKTTLNILNTSSNESGIDIPITTDFADIDWQYKLENQCRRSYSNSYIQEIYKAIYQTTAGHPPSGSADYYQAAQNYVMYGKHFLDFPENIQAVLNDKNSQNSVAESSNLITNFGNCLYSKPNTATSNTLASATGGLTTTTTTATSAAAYYHICNSMQAQARPTLSTNPGNSTAYGIFLGNKVTYVAGTPTTPSLIYNQHSTTTTNFISNSLANAALATSPTILYTNPMLTTTTQQYLTQFLSTAALTANSIQSATVATNASGAGVYERLIYAQMLQQQLYQTQQAAAVAAMFQHKQRVAAAAAARQSSNVININNNRSSPQHLPAAPSTSNSNGLSSNTCNRQARSSSPAELVGMKPQAPIAIAATETTKTSKSTSE